MNKLTRISYKNLQILKNIYSVERVKNAITINAITNILERIEKTPDLANRIEFLSLNDIWHKTGTILIKNESRIHFNTLEIPPFNDLKTALDAIDINGEITFVSISDRFREILHSFVWYNNLELIFEQGTTGYFMSKECAKTLPDQILPHRYEVRPLTIDYVDEINKESPREGGDHLGFVMNSIVHKQSLGIFEKSKNELVAWCFEMDYCSVGMGIVKGSLKRSGFGSFFFLTLAKRIAIERDMDITWHVIHGHKISQNFSQKCGGKKFDTFTWLSARKRAVQGASKFGLYQIVY